MKILLFSLLLLATTLAGALEDTTDNRLQQAERYLRANSPEDMFADIANRSTINLPPEQRKPFTDMLTKHMDIVRVSAAMKNAMVSHFTADELEALADFYSKPGAKSAMSKMGLYMADVLPVVQEEMQKAQQKAFNPSPLDPAISEKTPTTSPEND